MDYNNETKKEKDPTEGLVGVRKTLRDMGFSDSEIGYDNTSGTVTLGGKSLLKPSYLDEDAGVSYAKASDIQKSVVGQFQNSSNPVVRVSDAYGAAAGAYGLSADALSYGNGTVSIGGSPIDVLYIDDEGKAWARKNVVDNAVKQYADTAGVQTPAALAKAYASQYLSGAERLLNQLEKREAFSYDPDTDPVFQAYRKKYQLEGERAGREAIADMAALTGGYASSAAVTAGGQARQYYAKQMTDVVPELAAQAYQRYLDEYQADLDLVNEMVDLYKVAYQNAADANADQRANVNAVALSNVERDEKAWEKNWTDLQNQQKYEIAEKESDWNDKLSGLAVIQKNLQNKNLFLDYQEAEIYLKYYEELLLEELLGKQLSNNKTTQKSAKKGSSSTKKTEDDYEEMIARGGTPETVETADGFLYRI
ncbi:MAG: hypothetical protein J6A56_03010 [Clostridia bacterium]|nr:hypothetical protein [Clostridia bacterium]